MPNYTFEFDKNSNFSLIPTHQYSNHFNFVDIGDDGPPFYLFSSRHLDNVNDISEAWAKGKFLFAIFKAAHILCFEPASGKYIADGIKLRNMFKDGLNVTPTDDYNVLPRKAFDPQISFPSDVSLKMQFGKLIDLSRENEDVEKLLLQIGHGIDWINLYAIWDTLWYYSTQLSKYGKMLKKAAITESEIKEFTGTANNFGLLSIEARHGELGYKCPAKTKTLEQSQELVIRLCYSYMQIVYDL